MMHTTGGEFQLSGTIGQPDAGTMTGNTFELTGGFWFEIPLGDCEDDGDVDLFDYDQFQACLKGPNSSVSSECRCFDVDRSRSVDLADFAVIQVTHTGS